MGVKNRVKHAGFLRLPFNAGRGYLWPDFARSSLKMNPFLWLLDTVITLYIWVLIASAVLSWLVAFNVVNPYNNVVRTISGALYQLTEPLLRPIRNILPNLGGLDISPVILILILMFIRQTVFWLFAR